MSYPTWGDGLTYKQKLFCESYLKNGYNAKQAAISAGYSKETATVIGCQNLTKTNVKKYIGTRMNEIVEKTGVKIEWRLELLKKTAEASFNGQASKEGLVNPAGVVGSIQEINKMLGDHAPEKHAHLVEETENKVGDLMKKFEKDF